MSSSKKKNRPAKGEKNKRQKHQEADAHAQNSLSFASPSRPQVHSSSGERTDAVRRPAKTIVTDQSSSDMDRSSSSEGNKSEKNVNPSAAAAISETVRTGSRGSIIDQESFNSSEKAAYRNITETQVGEPPGTSSFARIVQEWEAYLGEGARNVQLRSPTEALQAPLQQMFQNLSLCGASQQLESLPRENEERRWGQNQSSPPRWRELSDMKPPGSVDPFEPIMLRHTHSSPMYYRSTTMFEDEDVPPLSTKEPMRRSSSTPASSAFRHSSTASAFGTHHRGTSGSSGNDGRSAFSLPMQRRSFAAMSDSGIYFSAFKPVSSSSVSPLSASAPNMATDDSKSIALTGASQKSSVQPKPSEESAKAKAVSSGKNMSRASRFLSDVKALRRRQRQRRSGRENPARPPSSSSSSRGDDDTNGKGSSDARTAQHAVLVRASSSGDEGSLSVCTSNLDDAETEGIHDQLAGEAHSEHENYNLRQQRDPVDLSFSNDSSDEECHADGTVVKRALTKTEVPGYHRLGSEDDDDEYRPESIEATSILRQSSAHLRLLPTHVESPTPIPSPAYHQFVDDQEEHSSIVQGGEIINTSGGRRRRFHETSSVRTGAYSASSFVVRHDDEGSSFSPTSLDSLTHFSRATTRSTITSNTSGHTTHATSTSATTNSEQMTVSSSVAEADREVMEANRAGRQRRQRQLHFAVRGVAGSPDMDGAASVHSSSTASTNAHGYLALASSPAPLREGACLPVDRFFGGSSIPITYSSSSNTNSTISGSAVPGATVTSKKPGEAASPHTVSSSSLANTTSSSSTGEEPPKFVSYLDRQTTGTALHVKVDAPAVARTGPQHSANRAKLHITENEDADERESPMEIAGYSRLVFEEAKAPGVTSSQHPLPVRPAKKRERVKRRWTKLKSKPPRSPVKLGGTRTPTSTPPPSSHSAGGSKLSISPSPTSSPANYQLSPPKHIMDLHGPYVFQQQVGTTVSRPHVLRSTSSTEQGKMLLVSPPPATCERGIPMHQAVVMSSPPTRSLTIVGSGADEGAQEVFTAPPSMAAVVSPDMHLKQSDLGRSRPALPYRHAVSQQETILESSGEQMGDDNVKRSTGLTQGVGKVQIFGISKQGKKPNEDKKGVTVTPEKGFAGGRPKLWK